MWSLILDNIKWIFSGIGVLILVGLWRWLSRNRKRKMPVTEGPAHQHFIAIPPEMQKGVDISGHDILTTIEEAPLLQRPDVRKHYIGLRVTWDGKLRSAKETGVNTIHLYINVEKGTHDWSVFVDVDPTQYPGLGLLKRNHPIRVSGVIAEIDGFFVLKDARIEYKIDK